jgi:tight adherence protein C
MSAAVLIAAVAGLVAAHAVVDLADVWAARRAHRSERAPAWRLLARLGRPLPAAPPPGLGARIAASGVRANVADVMAVKMGAAVAGVLVAGLLGPVLPGRLGWLALVAVPAAAFFAPDAWLRRRTHRRAAAMDAETADVLDLLRVAVGAGLPVGRALAEVGRRHPGVLAGELRRTGELLRLGVPFTEALDALALRCPAAATPALIAGLRRAHRHGAPLADALTALSQDARARRARAAAEAAARAAPKIQLVVALLLVPSAMLLLAAALVPAVAAS